MQNFDNHFTGIAQRGQSIVAKLFCTYLFWK